MCCSVLQYSSCCWHRIIFQRAAITQTLTFILLSRITIAFMCCAGILFSLLAALHCNFADYEYGGSYRDTTTIGLYRFDVDEYDCRWYKYKSFDTSMWVARICSLLAPCLAVVALALFTMEILCFHSRTSRWLIATLFISCVPVQSFSFFLFNSDFW